MKASGLLVLVIGSFLGAEWSGDDVRQTDKKLEGAWTIVSIERDPREKVAGEGKGVKIHVMANKATVTLPGKDQPCPGGAWIIKTDSSKNPHTIDVREANSKGGPATLGIYEIKGDTLKICWAPLEKRQRPAEFASKPGSGHGLAVLKREK